MQTNEKETLGRKFKLHKNPNDMKSNLFLKSTITIKPGVTVLVGCNGYGKTTLLHCIKENLEGQKIPVLHYNNLSDGGTNSRTEALFNNNIQLLAELSISSEGECIVANMLTTSGKIGNFVCTGNTRQRKLQKHFQKIAGIPNEEIEPSSNERWILLDAVDSGMSIDNIVELKEGLFETIIEHPFGKEVYIIVVANSYEMAAGENCFDVRSGKYVTFKDYDDYKKFVLESRKEKNKRDGVEDEDHE